MKLDIVNTEAAARYVIGLERESQPEHFHYPLGDDTE